MTHPPLSDDDKQFLRAILANPAERTAWLAYADWLDERDDPRAEFVRLELRFAAADVSQTERHAIAARLEEVRPTLDPDWVAIFDRPPVENCDAAFEFKCPKKWEELRGTDDAGVRHCPTCDEEVYYCQSLAEARGHARRGHCVAVATGVDRFPGDLGRPTGPPAVWPAHDAVRMTMGIMLPPEPEPPRRRWWKFW